MEVGLHAPARLNFCDTKGQAVSAPRVQSRQVIAFIQEGEPLTD